MRVPAVLTRAQAERLRAQHTGSRWLIVSPLYSVELRLMESPRLRAMRALATRGKFER